jgi:hypothetical protein
MSGVIYDEKIVRSIVFFGKRADTAIELQLRLFALDDIEFNGLGLVTEAVAEYMFEFLCLFSLISASCKLAPLTDLFLCP